MTQFRPGSFQILPVVIKNLLIINGLVFLAQFTIDGLASGNDLQPKVGALSNLFALHHLLSPLFKPWQLVTYLFMHGGIGHIFGNMFALWMFGSTLENLWGPRRFLIFYLLCGLGGAVLHLGALWYESMPLLADFQNFKVHSTIDNFFLFFQKHPPSEALVDQANNLLQKWQINPNDSQYAGQAIVLVTDSTNTALSGGTIGASGAVFGCLAAFAYLFPNNELFIFPIPFPVKVKWFMILYIGMELYLSAKNSAGDNVAHIAHLGGALVGFLLVYFWNRTNRRQFY